MKIKKSNLNTSTTDTTQGLSTITISKRMKRLPHSARRVVDMKSLVDRIDAHLQANYGYSKNTLLPSYDYGTNWATISHPYDTCLIKLRTLKDSTISVALSNLCGGPAFNKGRVSVDELLSFIFPDDEIADEQE